jgi:UDP-glucuronate decarboxylase
MKKILVTGGAGNVGSALISRLLVDTDFKIIVVDNLSTGSLMKIPNDSDRITFHKADVNNRQEIAEIMLANRFEYVFHYAAFVGVKRTQENPINVLEDIEGIKNLLSLSKNIGVKRFFFSSSSEVYGEPVDIPQHEETTPLNSRIPYAIVKNVGEAFCKSYYQEFGLNYTIFRFFNTYGPNQTKDFVISKFISSALKNEDITIYGDGTQTRTFCFVEDNVEATSIAFREDKHINDIVNIGGDIAITILDLAKLIIKITSSKSKIVHLPALAEGDMTRRLPDNTKMRNLLKRDLLSLEEGINRLLSDSHFLSQL